MLEVGSWKLNVERWRSRAGSGRLDAFKLRWQWESVLGAVTAALERRDIALSYVAKYCAILSPYLCRRKILQRIPDQKSHSILFQICCCQIQYIFDVHRLIPRMHNYNSPHTVDPSRPSRFWAAWPPLCLIFRVVIKAGYRD